jgi:hypothetical protein
MRWPLKPNPSEVELLLAAERRLVFEADALCDAAVERARAALPRRPHARLVSRGPMLRRSRVGLSVAAAVLLFAVSAAAFLAGYRTKTEELAKSAARPSRTPRTVTHAALAAPAASLAEHNPRPVLQASRPRRAAPAVAGRRSATSRDADLTELQVLRPAQRATARDDFASALAAIADHQRRFPSGQLTEEREALRVKALLGLGRLAEARRAGTAFRQRFPRSALLRRMDEMLETKR